MPFDRLYIKIKCPTCDGTKLFEHSGHHDPKAPYKWKSCPYCDYEGTQLIEASHQSVAEYIKQLATPEKQKLAHLMAAEEVED